MTREAIWDALARQASNIADVRAGYSLTRTYVDGVATTDRPGWPGVPSVTLVARIISEDADAMTGNREVIVHRFTIRIYSGADERQAQHSLMPMWDRLLVAFRSNVGMYGTCVKAVLTGYSELDFETFGANDERTHYFQDIYVEALESNQRTYSIGGS